ncbi:MAG: hypothetical protein ACLQNU_00850, partial [Candidatus Dormibacteria bacterium]
PIEYAFVHLPESGVFDLVKFGYNPFHFALKIGGHLSAQLLSRCRLPDTGEFSFDTAAGRDEPNSEDEKENHS